MPFWVNFTHQKCPFFWPAPCPFFRLWETLHLATNSQDLVKVTTLTQSLVENLLFQNMVILHIKLKGMKCGTTYKQKIQPYSHPRPLGWGQKVKTVLFLKMVTIWSCTLHIKLKGNDMYNDMQPIILSLHALSTPVVGSKGQQFSENGCVAYHLKGIMQANILPLPWVGLNIFFLLKDQINRKVAHAHTMVIYTMGGLCRVGDV